MMGDNPNVQVITTSDGSHSLFVPSLNETYHSSHGALQESQHVFIAQGLATWREEKPSARELRILEVGFGTGLNALLSLREAQRLQIPVMYTSLEPYPVATATVAQLNYGQLLGEEWVAPFGELHQAPWEEAVRILPFFTLQKKQAKLETVGHIGSFDLIYFDAFAPNKQAELWEVAPLQLCFEMTAPDGMLVTYCAQGQFKRNLKAAGYIVERLPGPPGKKEMTRGRRY